MCGIALDIQHLHAIANVTAWPPPGLVYYPRIEIVATAHHDNLFSYIHLAHLVENPQYDGDAAAELVHDCLLDDLGGA